MLRRIFYATVLLLSALTLSAQDTLQVTVGGTPTDVAYTDIIVVQATNAGKALIFYGSGYTAITTDEDYEVVTSYTTCGLLPFTERTTGRRQAVSQVNVDTILNQAGYALVRVQPVFIPSPTTYATVESYSEVFADKYDCGTLGDLVRGGENIGYGYGVFKDKDRESLRFKTLVPGANVTITPGPNTLTISAAGGGGGGGATDLSNTANASSVTVESSTGDNTVIAAATTAAAGVMTATDKTKLNGIETGATADQTGSEIVTLVNQQLGSTAWQGSGGGSTRAVDTPTAIGAASLKVVRLGGSATTFGGSAAAGYTVTLAASSEALQVDFTGNSTTSNASGELVLAIDNSANSYDRFYIVRITDLSNNSQVDMELRGHTVTQTVAGNVTTLTIANIAGGYPSGFRALLR